MKASEVDTKNYEEKIISLTRKINDLEDSNSTTLLDSSDKMNRMNRKMREQATLIESLTHDLKDSVTEISRLKKESEDRVNALISQRNVFTSHIEKMDNKWRDEIQNVINERDQLKVEITQLVMELKKLQENPSVLSARQHAREMEEKLKSNERDMERLIDSMKNEKMSLINRVYDQSLTIHTLTDSDRKNKEDEWMKIATGSKVEKNIKSNNSLDNGDDNILKTITGKQLNFNDDIMNTPITSSSTSNINNNSYIYASPSKMKVGGSSNSNNASLQYQSIVNSPLPDFLK